MTIVLFHSLMQQITQDQDQDEARAFLHQVGSPLADSPPGTFLNPTLLAIYIFFLVSSGSLYIYFFSK